MPKSPLFVPVAKGLDQSTSERVAQADIPLRVENCQFDQHGKLVKRNGFQPVDPGGLLQFSNARSILSSGAELLVLGDRTLYAHDPVEGRWLPRGPIASACGRAETIFRDEQWYFSADAASGDGYTMYLAQRAATLGISGTLFEMTATIHSTDRLTVYPVTTAGYDQSLADEKTRPHSPRVAHATDRLYGFYVVGITDEFGAPTDGTIKVIEWDTSTAPTSAPTTWGTLGTVWVDATIGTIPGLGGIVGRPGNIRTYDAVSEGGGGILLARIDPSQNVHAERYDDTLALQFSVQLTDVADDPPAFRVTTVDDDDDNALYVMAVLYESPLRSVMIWKVRKSSMTLVWGPVQVEATTTGEEFTNLGLCVGPYGVVATWTTFLVASSDYQRLSLQFALVDKGSGTVFGPYHRGGLSSRVKPWFVGDDYYVGAETACTAAMWTGGAETLDPASGVLGADYPQVLEPYQNALDANVVFRLASRNDFHLAGVYDVGTAAPVIRGLIDIGNGQTSHTPAAGVFRWTEIESMPRGLEVSEIEHDYNAEPRAVTLSGGAVVVGGAFVSWYDGDRVVELGHVHPPMPYEVRDVDLPIGEITVPTFHAWQAHWVSYDANGVLHRSAPSFRFTREIGDHTPAFSASSVRLFFRSCGATNRSEIDYGVAVYREEYPSDVGSTGNPQRINRQVEGVLNTTGVTTSVFYDRGWDKSTTGYSPTASRGYELLYTAGGELEAVCPEGARLPAVVNGRLWLGDFYRRERVQYSKPFAPGTASETALAPEFNEGFGFVLPGSSQVTGIAALDQDVVIFTDSEIYLNAGDGPDDNGLGNDYSGPRRISSDSGCIDARSVVVTPDGVMFQSDAGLYLLDRGRSVRFVGEAVQKELDAFPVVTSAVLVPDENHVRFTVTNAAKTDGAILVFDYSAKQWLKWTLKEGTRLSPQPVVPLSACLHQGEYFILEKGSTTGSRVWKLDHTLWRDSTDIPIAMVVETAWIQSGQHGGWQRAQNVTAMCERIGVAEVTISVSTDFHAAGGSAQSYTWTDAELQTFPRFPDTPVRMKLIDQKSHAVKVTLTEESNTQGIALSGFRFDLITKRGAVKVAEAQRA